MSMLYSFAACLTTARVVNGESEVLHLLQTTAINQHGHGGPVVKCPAGYHVVPGIGQPHWADCPGTTLKGWCVLPTENAYALCNKDPECTMVSHTSNHGWLGSFGSNSVQASKGAAARPNSQWTSCVKDPGFHSCPEGYDRVEGLGREVWANCPGTTLGGYCVLPAVNAYRLCDSDPSCTMVSHTTNKGWLGAYGAGSVQVSKGKALNKGAKTWSSCVKRPGYVKLRPPITCPFGYEGVQGIYSGRWPNCPGTTLAGWCVLPKEKGYELCNSEPSCTMVSHTSNAGWLRKFGQNSVQLGRGTAKTRGSPEWASCKKLITTTTTTTVKMFEPCPVEGKVNTNECPAGCTFVDNCAQCELAAKHWGKTYSTEPFPEGSPRPRGCFRNRKFLIKCNAGNPEGPYKGKYPICQKI